MDDATLERLMMDDALRALSPDVKALLGAYVQSSAKEATRHRQWIELGVAAEEAVRVTPVATLPPFLGWKAQSVRLWSGWLAIAAAVMVGIGIGLFMRRPDVVKTAAVQTSVPVVAQPAEMVGVTDFWSSKRLIAEALAMPRNPSPQWQWPGRITRTGDQP